MCDVWPGQWEFEFALFILFCLFSFEFECTEARLQSFQLATGPITSNYVTVSDIYLVSLAPKVI